MESFSEKIQSTPLIVSHKQRKQLIEMNCLPYNAITDLRIPTKKFENGKFYRINTHLTDPSKKRLA